MTESATSGTIAGVNRGELLAKCDELVEMIATLSSTLKDTNEKLAIVSEHADEDPKFPILSGTAFHREALRLCRLSRRHDQELSLLYVNVDAFRQINATFGRRGGDAVLKAVIQKLVELMRTSDIIGRLGADEFGVLLIQSSLPGAELKAQSLKSYFDSNQIPFLDDSISIRLTVGIQTLQPRMWVDDLIDGAVATAKRNRQGRPDYIE
jgi:diguanylate cyclase (GGDEF)-like protein